jgi:hypothetical protein
MNLQANEAEMNGGKEQVLQDSQACTGGTVEIGLGKNRDRMGRISPPLQVVMWSFC